MHYVEEHTPLHHIIGCKGLEETARSLQILQRMSNVLETAQKVLWNFL